MRISCRSLTFAVFLLLSAFAGFGAETVTNRSDRAGWAEVVITPPLGIALGGRGGADAEADKILDPLMAGLFLLEDKQGQRLVLISLDLVGLQHDYSDQVRLRVASELGIPVAHVVVNCSHTHSGPLMYRDLFAGIEPAPEIEVKYLAELQSKVLGLARSAAKNLQAVKLETALGRSPMGINRRGRNKQGQPGILPNPSGPVDETVWILRATARDETAGAILFSFGCHPVMVYGFDYRALSADFPGTARLALKTKLGDKVHVQFLQALGGDVRPRINADLGAGRFVAGGRSEVTRMGEALAGTVVEAIKQGGQPLSLDLGASYDRPFLPRGNPPDPAHFERMKTNGNKFQQAVAGYWLERYRKNEGFSRGDSWPVGLIRLSTNQWICYLAGEPVSEWGKKIQTWMAPLNLVVWGYCQEAISYLPVESQLGEGGYEVLQSNFNRATTPAPFAPGIEEAVKRSVLRQREFLR